MRHPSLARSTAAAVSAAALVLTVGTAAYAGPPWTMSVGGSTSAPASFTAATIGTNPDITWAWPGQTLICDNGTVGGTLTPGATASKAGEITSLAFNNCDGWLGIPLPWTQTATWDINILADNVGGVTPVEIGNVSARVENPDGLCSFDVTGSVGGTFDQNTQQLSVSGGGLTMSNVDQCFGLVLEDDPMTLEMTLQLDGIDAVTVANS